MDSLPATCILQAGERKAITIFANTFLKISHTQHIRQNKTGNMFRLIKPSLDPVREDEMDT